MADKINTGALFQNDRTDNPKAPNYRGNFVTNQAKFSLSAWENGTAKSYVDAGRGALFQNPNKKTEKHPDMIGSITTPDGDRYFISAWDRESAAGNPYKSLSIKAWEGQFTQIDSEFMSLACQLWK